MQRYFLEISYDGTAYHGWQKQKNSLTVQQIIEEKLSLKLKQQINVVGCCRTDTGVHALQFFLHFDSDQIIELDSFLFKLNRFLPIDIVARSIHNVTPEANARFSAIERTYKYFIQTKKNPFNRYYSYEYTMLLDIEKMNKACELLIKNNDFTSFSKLHGGQKNYICKLTECQWEKLDQQLIFTISANRFTRNMVRAIVGTIIEVGKGSINISDFKRIIDLRNRSFASNSVEAKGLFLAKVLYPQDIFLKTYRIY